MRRSLTGQLRKVVDRAASSASRAFHTTSQGGNEAQSTGFTTTADNERNESAVLSGPEHPIYSQVPLQSEKSIRLVRVQHSTEQLIECSLEVADLSNQPIFQALSYRWGAYSEEAEENGMTDARCFPILCNGEELLVTQNLYEFLGGMQQMDLLEASDCIWIDAICINQTDMKERGRQVTLMGDIYRSASRVIVWLGEGDKDTPGAIDLFSHLASKPLDQLKLIDPFRAEDENTVAVLGRFAGSSHWRAFSALLRRSWFSRAWIIQEIVLAREIVFLCGEHIITWGDMLHVSEYISTSAWSQILKTNKDLTRYKNVMSVGATPMLLHLMKEQMDKGYTWHIEASLMQGRKFDATDPRDKVFAVLGISGGSYHQSEDRSFFADYSKSIADIYTEATISILEDMDSLSMLSCVEDGVWRKHKDLPSWVPDWSVREFMGFGIIGHDFYSAARSLPRQIEIDKKGKQLKVRGTRLDSVVKVGESKEQQRANFCFPNWLEIVRSLDSVYRTGQTRFEIFWRTLIVNKGTLQYPAPEILANSFRQWLVFSAAVALISSKEFGKYLEETEGTIDGLALLSREDTGDMFPSADEVRDFATNVTLPPMSMPDRFKAPMSLFDAAFDESSFLSLFSTGQGYLGMGSQSVLPGDSVWIIPGTRVPFLLRGPDDLGRYALVGEAYVHGFMNGEALDTPNMQFVDLKIV